MKDISILTNGGVNIEKSMEIFGDMPTYDETLLVFLTEVDGKISKLKQFKDAGNMADYAIIVHSLKSDAKYFGFETLAELAYQHEIESKSNHVYYVYEHYDELMRETNRIIELVNRYIKDGEEKSDETVPSSVITSETNEGIPLNSTSADKKIIIADDSDIIRSVMEKIFADTYVVLSAKDGKHAIELVEKYKDNELLGLLLDLNMPNIDGFEVLEYFKNNNLFEKIPVSIITGNDDVELDKKAFTYPIIDILKKPFNENNIRSVVERTINTSRDN